jgi:hypothetical protein
MTPKFIAFYLPVCQHIQRLFRLIYCCANPAILLPVAYKISGIDYGKNDSVVKILQ